MNYSYDGLERLEKLTAGSLYTKNYSYANPAGTAGTTTGLVSNLTYKKPNGTTIADFSYSYDSMGRIVSDGAYRYSYDSLGQLLTVTDNAGHTVESYVYDGAGNILSAVKNGTTHSYSYGDSEWKDLLTGYDGQSITYDAIGNPTGYLGNTLTWQNGRELATFTNSQYSISYSYDVNGLRTEKAVIQNGVTTDYQYFYNGSTLLQERIDNGTGTDTVLNFIYTADGKPYALEYSTNNGSSYTTCYYLTNLQGDVVSILDSNGAAVVTYSYDSWGKITQTTGTLEATLGKDNPLRYRGYVYDEETNLYYLQSRYYDPQVGRFINADDTKYLGIDGAFSGYNLFSYCGNNSVIRTDQTGRFFGAVAGIIATGAIIGGVLGAFSAACTGGNILESAAEGFLTGAIGSACGILISNPIIAVGLAVLGGTSVDIAVQVTTQYIGTQNIDLSNLDYGRAVKTGILTGVGTAIPSLGEGAKNAGDALGTALIWAEASTLITCIDVVVTNTIAVSRSSFSDSALNCRSVTAFTRKLLCS